MKALGTGTHGVRWKDIEVVRTSGRAPTIELHGTALNRADQLGITHIAVSLSHSKEFAVAVVVAESASSNQNTISK